MGAWDSGAFDNDAAADWVAVLVDDGDADEVTTALEIVAEAGREPVEADTSSKAVAAAEIVSAARGHACRGFPEELKDWIRDRAFYADSNLTKTAGVAVNKVLSGSELAELWDSDRGWRLRMDNLTKRLSKPTKTKPPKTTRTSSAATKPSDTKALVKKLRKLGADVDVTRDGVIQGIDLSDGNATATDIPMIAQISTLLGLAIYYEDFGDADLKQLSLLPCLENLNILFCKKVTDDGLRHLAKIPTLGILDISYCDRITDAGLAHLAGLGKLESLNLSYTNVSDDGLNHLMKLSRLTSLNVEGTGVTKKGVEALRKALPECSVEH